MNKIYDIFLDKSKIGTTELEKADAPMGVAFGQIKFVDIISGYEFFKLYCLENKIEIALPPWVLHSYLRLIFDKRRITN